MDVAHKLAQRWIARWRAWISVGVMAPFAFVAVFSASALREWSPAELLLKAAGWICFCAGATLRWWSTLYIGGRKNQALAVEGPYSICRNPLYLGSFLLALSIACFLHSAAFVIGLLLATPIYLSITVPWEERKLLQVFGEQFAEYRDRVPKFVPRFRLLHASAIVPVSVFGLKKELRNCLRWMWIPLVADLISDLKTKPWWPEVFRLP